MKEKIRLHKYSGILLIITIIMLAISSFELSLSKAWSTNIRTGLNTLLISGVLIAFLIETLEFKANKRRYLKPEKKVIITPAHDKLKKCLEYDELKSVLVNGKTGSGKTTLVTSSLESKFILMLDPFTDNIKSNYLDYLFNEVRFTNIYSLIIIVIMWLIIIILNQQIFKLDSISLIVMGVMITFLIKTFKVNRKIKQKLIINELKTLDFIVIDNIDESLRENQEVLKLIHFIHSNLTENQKLILVSNLEKSKVNFEKISQYFDFRIDVENDQVKASLIDKFDVDTYNIDDDLIQKLMLEVSLVDLEKINVHYQLANLKAKSYRNDEIFKLILMYHHGLNQAQIEKLIYEVHSLKATDEEIMAWIKREFNCDLSMNQFKYLKELVTSKVIGRI